MAPPSLGQELAQRRVSWDSIVNVAINDGRRGASGSSG
jgi:hypothetical protein